MRVSASLVNELIQLQKIPISNMAPSELDETVKRGITSPVMSLKGQVNSRREKTGPGNEYIVCSNCVRHPAYPTVAAVTLHVDGKCEVCGIASSLMK
jgi:hypothetical protein